MTLDESTCLTLLKSVIAKLQPYEKSSANSRYEAIKPHLADSFESIDLVVHIGEIKNIERIISEKDKMIFIDFIDSGNCRQRANFIREISPNGWKVVSLKFECPCCFGEGINDGETCILCGGTGWGAR